MGPSLSPFFLAFTTKFIHRLSTTDAKTAYRLLRLVAPSILKGIQYFEQDQHLCRSTKHEGRFSLLFNLLCKHVPPLCHFLFRTDGRPGDVGCPEYDTHDLPTTDRHQLTAQARKRFGSLLILRHRNLDVLTWLSDSGLAHDGPRAV